MPSIHRYDPADRDTYVSAYRDDPRSLLRIDDGAADRLVDTITAFYRDHVDDAGMDGYVVGLSGGIDSTVTAYLLADAVGAANVHGLILPAAHTEEQDVQDAETVADTLGITTNSPDTFREQAGSIVDTLEQLGAPVDDPAGQRVKRGNILARCRMTVIRDVAKARHALVAGTTNASERDIGYMTLAADGLGGIDNEALYDLYKSTVRDLARYLGVPERIIEKTPSADLWQGQTDAAEIGYTYDVLDQVLAGLQLDLDRTEIAAVVDDITDEDVDRIAEQVATTAYKRQLPPTPNL